MPQCQTNQDITLGTETALGVFSFANNFAYNRTNGEIIVGPANAQGDITSTNCVFPLGNRIKIEISKKPPDATGTSEYCFKIIPNPNPPTLNLNCVFSDAGSPTFTVRNINNNLSFIGIDDVRTGRANLIMDIDDGTLPTGVFLQYDSTQGKLTIEG